MTATPIPPSGGMENKIRLTAIIKAGAARKASLPSRLGPAKHARHYYASAYKTSSRTMM